MNCTHGALNYGMFYVWSNCLTMQSKEYLSISKLEPYNFQSGPPAVYCRMTPNSPVDNYRKTFKNNFSLRPLAYALIFWIYMRDGVHKGKMFVSKLIFSRKFDLGAYSHRYPPKFSYLGGGVIKS